MSVPFVSESYSYLYLFLFPFFFFTDVAEKDANTECKKLAIQALVLLENSFKNVGKFVGKWYKISFVCHLYL